MDNGKCCLSRDNILRLINALHALFQSRLFTLRQSQEALEQFQRECRIDFSVVDITTDPELFEKYKHGIPVLNINGTEAAKHFITLEKLRVLAKRHVS